MQQLCFCAEPRGSIRRLEQPLLVGEVEQHCRRDQVRKQQSIVGQVGSIDRHAASGAEQRQVAREQLGDEAGQLPGGAGVLPEQLHVGSQVVRRRVHLMNDEPGRADREDVEPAVVVRLDLPELRRTSDRVQRTHTVGSDLATFADRYHAELPTGAGREVDELADEQPVALLEDVQGQRYAGEEHGAEREQRQPHGHARQGTASRTRLRWPPMLTRVDLRGRSAADVRTLLPRAGLDVTAALAAVRPLCDDVRDRGVAAVRDATARFDGVDIDELRVPGARITAAADALNPDLRAALEQAIQRTRAVHEAQRPAPSTTVEPAPGVCVTERWIAVDRVGLYVPGGNVAYPSSVVMNVVPAQVAGVRSIAVTSPPQPEYDGQPHPAVLGACALLGVEEVYRVGGAQAIAMLAYGVDGCAPVDVVTGPGNVYVAAAKRYVRGVVGIDAEAGPTEIAILADDTAAPAQVAADLVAQAEHDAHAACLLVTDSAELLDAVDAELVEQVAAARHRERIEAALSGQSAYVLVDDLAAGTRVIDAWAPEHVEVLTRDAAAVAGRLRNAGAVFVGPWSPVSLGDYLAGSNHVLPTGGTARHSGGLSVFTFLRQVHVVEATREGLADAAPYIDALGGAEDLAAHVAAVRARIPR